MAKVHITSATVHMAVVIRHGIVVNNYNKCGDGRDGGYRVCWFDVAVIIECVGGH